MSCLTFKNKTIAICIFASFLWYPLCQAKNQSVGWVCVCVCVCVCVGGGMVHWPKQVQTFWERLIRQASVNSSNHIPLLRYCSGQDCQEAEADWPPGSIYTKRRKKWGSVLLSMAIDIFPFSLSSPSCLYPSLFLSFFHLFYAEGDMEKEYF